MQDKGKNYVANVDVEIEADAVVLVAEERASVADVVGECRRS